MLTNNRILTLRAWTHLGSQHQPKDLQYNSRERQSRAAFLSIRTR